MLKNQLFYCKNKDIYPPFKKGYYMEEFFLDSYKRNNPNTKRKYIPVLWTNFQIEGWFKSKKAIMQKDLDEWIRNNPSDNGYFTIVQHDDGPMLNLPKNTVVYGACSGNIPLPLIYEDTSLTLEKVKRKSFKEKTILCSFVGTFTHTLRKTIHDKYNKNKNFDFSVNRSWTPNVNKNCQDNFINKTINSKFALAPRGYGRSSFRFFEIFKLGTVPIYVWDDKNWLPYQDVIDYTKIAIVINIKDIAKLENILLNINEEQYNTMLKEHEKIKEKFYLPFMYHYIIENEIYCHSTVHLES